MMKVMAIDYAQLGTRVNMVVPDLIDTPMNAPVMKDAKELTYWSNQIPIGRAGTADARQRSYGLLPMKRATASVRRSSSRLLSDIFIAAY